MLILCSEIPNGTYPKEDLIDGAIGAAQTAAEVGAESDLDFQSSWPLIWPQKEILFQTDDQYYEINQTTENTPYLGFWNSKSWPSSIRLHRPEPCAYMPPFQPSMMRLTAATAPTARTARRATATSPSASTRSTRTRTRAATRAS